MNQAKISVVMPSLNQGKYIGEAIESVLDQSYRHVELIVIDGGSMDQSVAVIKSFEKHIKFWSSEPDSGQSNAINKGMAHADGDILTWLNSDDRYRPGTLELVCDTFKEKPTDIVHGQASLFGRNFRRRTTGIVPGLQPHDYLPYMRFPQPASFFSRDAYLKSAPLSENLHYAMDFELVAKMILAGAKATYVPRVLADYRLHAESKTNQEELFLKEWTLVLLNIFRSTVNGPVFSEKLRRFISGGATPPVVYPQTRNFSMRELQSVYLEHLLLHFHFHYRRFEKAHCLMLAAEIEREDPAFAHAKQLRKYLGRLRYFSPLLALRRRLWN